ncbi:MAG: hypothetical protein NVSMB51_13450 [Solirubrobacteraceae bacterium]
MRAAGFVALGALALAGCGGAAQHAKPPIARSSTASVAKDGNPVPVASDLQLPPAPNVRPASLAGGHPARACVARGPSYVEHRATVRKLVALTFDDGPSGWTPALLSVLESRRARASFFLIGQQIAGHEALLARELRDGDAIGDHTWTHADMTQLPGPVRSRQIALTAQAIQRASGFTTCFWRAPFGAIDAGIERLARAQGLLSVQWDVDPQDFEMPPVAMIIRRVLHGNPKNPDRGVRPGSIVLMHDGGGDRSHTVAALARLIDALRGRGYTLVTVPELLGLRLSG